MSGKEERLNKFTEKQQDILATGNKSEKMGNCSDCETVNNLVDIIIKEMEKREIII